MTFHWLLCDCRLFVALVGILVFFGSSFSSAVAEEAATSVSATDADGADAAIERAITLFAAGSFKSTIAGAEEIAASGVDHAADALAALSKRRVYINAESSAAAYRKGRDHFDLRTGARLEARPAGAKSVRVNNRVRNAIKSALGTLQLRASDPAVRIKAAEAVARAGNTQLQPALKTLLENEKDEAVRIVFAETLAELALADPKAAAGDKISAIETLRQRGDQSAAALIRQQVAAPDAALATAAQEALASIETRLQVVAALQNVWYGLSLGSVLLLAAVGLAITFGVMGVINMAHGEMVMLGAYTTFTVQEAFRMFAPEAFDFSLLVAIPAAFLVAGLVGIAIERGIIRFLYGRPLETLLATWGVSLILQQAVRTIYGPTNRDVGAPSFMAGGFEFYGLEITYGRLWIIVFALVVFALLLLVLKASKLGLHMRAVTQNRRMAASMGINTRYVDAMTFGLGSGIAGIAGVALSQIDNVSPNLGQSYIVDSFMVVVFGGVGNLWGTLVSALALGIGNKLMEPWTGAVLAKILILVAIILFIQKRPRGLFALKGRAVEA
ncbi:MAG: urea ABC transporter permease subunit UrtB [Pseudomonadota bacterium]